MTLFGLAAINAAFLFATTYSETAEKAIGHLLKHPRSSDLSIVTPEIREEVTMFLRRMASGADPNSGINSGLHSNPQAQLVLLRLGDEKTIGEFLKKREEVESKYGGMTATMENPEVESAQPLLISRLAPRFFREDGDKVTVLTDDDLKLVLYPVSVASSLSVLAIMKGSPVFSASLREWAGAMRESVTNENAKLASANIGNFPDSPSVPATVLVEFRKSMRAWWKENARSFETKDYASVKPSAWLAADKTPAAAETGKDATRSPTDPPNALPKMAEAAPAPSPSLGFLWTCAAAVLALLAGLLVFWKRRSH